MEHGAGDLAQVGAVAAAVAAETLKGLVGRAAVDLGQGTLGLLDDGAAVERRLQLLGEALTVPEGPFLEQPDGGDVGQCWDDADVLRRHLTCLGAEEVQCSDDLLAEPHGNACTDRRRPPVAASPRCRGRRPGRSVP